MKKYFFLLLAAISALSCSQGKSESDDLKLTFSNAQAYLIEDTASSCLALTAADASGAAAAKDVSSFYFSLQNPQLAWDNASKTVSISLMRVSFKNPYVTYTKTLGADELLAVFNTTGTLAPGATTSPNSLCPNLRFGGVNPTEGSSFSVTATIEIIGFSKDSSSGEQFPITAKATIPIVKLK